MKLYNILSLVWFNDFILLPIVCFFLLPRRRQWHPTRVLLPGKSHGWRSLEGCSPWGCWGSDTTERLHFHFSLSCTGEGNGNPLQYSCLENPRDREPGGLPSMGSHRVRHDWSDLAAAAAFFYKGFPAGTSVKNPLCQYRSCKRCGFDLWVGKIPWRRAWKPIPVFLPRESHRQRSLAGYGS